MCLLQDIKRIQIIAWHLKAVRSKVWKGCAVYSGLKVLVCAATSIVSFMCYKNKHVYHSCATRTNTCYKNKMELHCICYTVPITDNSEGKMGVCPWQGGWPLARWLTQHQYVYTSRNAQKTCLHVGVDTRAVKINSDPYAGAARSSAAQKITRGGMRLLKSGPQVSQHGHCKLGTSTLTCKPHTDTACEIPLCSCRKAHDNGHISRRSSQKACTAPRPSRTSSQSAPRHARASSTLWLLFFSSDANACHATQRLWLDCSVEQTSTLAPPAEIRLAARAATKTPHARCAGCRSDSPRPVCGGAYCAHAPHTYTPIQQLYTYACLSRACARFRQWRAVCLLRGRAASLIIRLYMLLLYR